MNSGKSDTLIKTAYNYAERGLRPIVLKPSIDSKGGDTITARGGSSRTVDVLVDTTTDVRSSVDKFDNVACVLVDESQFLSTEQIDQLYQVAKLDDISVICYGLRTDFKTVLFPGSNRLFELADNIEKLPTMCFCGSQAEFSTRRVDGQYVFGGDQDQVAIDGAGTVSYDSLCGKCYMENGGRIAGQSPS